MKGRSEGKTAVELSQFWVRWRKGSLFVDHRLISPGHDLACRSMHGIVMGEPIHTGSSALDMEAGWFDIQIRDVGAQQFSSAGRPKAA
jgi:hypothetical protein